MEQSHGRLGYDPDHVLPYLLDMVACIPQTARLGYVGARTDTFTAFAKGWDAMGGVRPVQIPDTAPWLTAGGATRRRSRSSAGWRRQTLRLGAGLLGLHAGDHPLVSYMARLGASVTITGPNAPRLLEDQVDRQDFQRLVLHKPDAAGGGGFDACWSISQASLQGSIAKGGDFILRSLDLLRPGGTAVHLFEFNFADDERTIDDWSLVLFQRRHIEALVDRLVAAGHEISPLSFHVGHQPLDRYVDVPPFETTRTAAFDRLWRDGWQSAHLKASIDGFACTTFGLIARRGA
jgi:hypothetical protein